MQVIAYRENGDTSNIERVFLYKDSGATAGTEGDPITGLTNASSGLNISTIAHNEAAPNTDTSAATSSIETIATLGTYATPTAGFVRFKEVDATDTPGLYELQWENARYAISSGLWLDICISGVADLAPFHGRIYTNPIASNVTEIGADAQSATDLKDFADAGYNPATNKVTGVLLTDTVTTVTGGATSAAQTTAQNDLDIITDSDGIIIGAAAVDLIWDEVLTGATHNVNNSSGKRLRQIDAAFTVHAGTAQAGTATTITLDALAEATDNIYRGDRVIIVGGTGVEEHGIIVSYVGSTKVATMAETWTITPDATSEFELTPASVDVETWQHNVVTASAGGLPDVNVNEVGDTAQTAGDLAALINALQDLSAAQVNAEVDTALADFFTSSAQLVDDVWDEVISKAAHNVAQSAAKVLRQSGDLIQIAGAISDVSPTTTDFDTDLTQADTFFADSVMVFVNGAANAGIGKVVSTYVNASGHVTFTASMAWPVTPVNGDDFVIVALHSHPITEIQAGLATEAKQDIIDTNVDAVLVDTADMQPKLGSPAADVSADIAAVKVDTAATLVDTAVIGVAGAGLTDLGGMSTAMKAEVNVEADTALTDYDGPTNAEMEARTPTAAQLVYIVANAAVGLPVTFSGTGTTTTGTLALVDGATPSAVDDQYNGRVLIFNAGTLNQVATDITDYNGTTKVATVTAVPVAITSAHTARLV